MKKIPLSLAVSDADHTRDIVTGKIPVEGVELTALDLAPEEIFYRFTKYREWDISEMSMGKIVSLHSQNDTSITAIPVFVSRVFRHSMIYVRDDGKIKRAEQLNGKRIGVPEWAQTAGIYCRGILTHTAGVPLNSVHWVQAGVNEPGRVEKVKLKLPKGMKYTIDHEHTLSELLLAGKIDAILSARQPNSFGKGVVRLFPDYQKAEEAYFRKTGIYPIMHVISFKTEVLKKYPWVAMNVYTAFEEAKRLSYARMGEIGVSRVPLPWMTNYGDRMRSLFGNDYLPYGIEPNRTTLQAFIDYAYEQGVCHRRVAVEELFAESTLTTHKV
ncbi:MAG: 4,5-dihydroxyphthalate decarboxylase [Betaproteobacteria bacterium]|nr:4,5-dihydroxyphthalate decarboxylase [Betaproteobacteria bacterium]